MIPLNEEQINLYNQNVARKQHIDNLEQIIINQINEMKSEEDELALTPNDVNPDIWEELIVEASKEVVAVDKILNNKIKNLIRKTKVKVDEMEEKLYIPESIKKEQRNFYTQPIVFKRVEDTVTEIVEKLFKENNNEIYTDVDKDALIEATEGHGLEENGDISSENFVSCYQNIAEAFNVAVAVDVLSELYQVPDRLALELFIAKYQYIHQCTQNNPEDVMSNDIERVEGEVVD